MDTEYVTLVKDWAKWKAGEVILVDALRAEALVDRDGLAVRGKEEPKPKIEKTLKTRRGKPSLKVMDSEKEDTGKADGG